MVISRESGIGKAFWVRERSRRKRSPREQTDSVLACGQKEQTLRGGGVLSLKAQRG